MGRVSYAFLVFFEQKRLLVEEWATTTVKPLGERWREIVLSPPFVCVPLPTSSWMMLVIDGLNHDYLTRASGAGCQIWHVRICWRARA